MISSILREIKLANCHAPRAEARVRAAAGKHERDHLNHCEEAKAKRL
jgi:hypothetical protein